MKKKLCATASFFVLGALLMSPLHAMEQEKEDILKKRNFPFSTGDLEQPNGSQLRKKRVMIDPLQNPKGSQDIKYAALKSRINGIVNTYSIDDYRKERNLCLEKGRQNRDVSAFKDGISYAHQVTDFPGATNEDWRIARDAYRSIGKYETAGYFASKLPDSPNNPLKLDDTRIARYICLQTEAFDQAYEHSKNVIAMQGEDATFNDYCHLSLSYIGSFEYNVPGFSKMFDENIRSLENKWGQDDQVQFFISFLRYPQSFNSEDSFDAENSHDSEISFDPDSDLVRRAKAMPMKRMTDFIYILKAYVLEKTNEDTTDLRQDYCKKFSTERYDSKLKLLDTIYSSLLSYYEEQDFTGPSLNFYPRNLEYKGLEEVKFNTLDL